MDCLPVDCFGNFQAHLLEFFNQINRLPDFFILQLLKFFFPVLGE